MSINPEYKTIEKMVTKTFEEQNTVECSLNLSDNLSDNVLSLTASIIAGNCEIKDDTIRYGGKILFNLVYLSEGAERIEAGAEFGFGGKGEYGEQSVADVCYELVSLEIKKSSGLLYAVAVINAKITVSSQQPINYLSNINTLKNSCELQTKNKIHSKNLFELEDEFETTKIKRVLSSYAQPTVLNVQAGLNTIIIDGEVCLSVVVLPFSENSDILKEIRIVPFRLELEADGVSPDDICTGDAECVGVTLKAYVEEGSEKTTINAVINLQLSAACETPVIIPAVLDCYCTNCKLNLSQTVFDEKCICAHYSISEKILGKYNCQIPENSRFITLIDEKCTIANINQNNAEVQIDCLVEANALFIDGEGRLTSTSAELPITISTAFDGEFVENIRIKPFNAQAKLRNGKLEADGLLMITFTAYKNEKLVLVSDVLEGESLSSSDASISVYLAKGGDTEWDIVKELGVPIEAIYEYNPELVFPLNGSERIICFRQK